MSWALLLSLFTGGALAYAYMREESAGGSQHSLSDGVVLLDESVKENHVNLGGSSVEPQAEPLLNHTEPPLPPILNRYEPPLNLPEPTLNPPVVTQYSAGDGFPKFDTVEGCMVGRFDPSVGGLHGVPGEFLEWAFLRDGNLNQSSIIWRTWGAKKGETRRYKLAKARHDLYKDFSQDYNTQREIAEDERDD